MSTVVYYPYDVANDSNTESFWLEYPHNTVYDARTRSLYKVFAEGNTYYAKIYKYPTLLDIWKIFFRGGVIGKSRASVEYTNLQNLYSKGLSPKPILLLEKRYGIFLVRSFLLMKEIPWATNMDHFIFDRWSKLSKEQRFEFIKSLALTTKKMNEDGFVNGEYHWRNILVIEKENSFQFKVIDCCKNRVRDRYLYPLLDVASLDVYTEKFFSLEERLTFLKIYLGVAILTEKHDKIIKSISQLKKRISLKEIRRYKNSHQNWQNTINK